jgi:hypothetical protein
MGQAAASAARKHFGVGVDERGGHVKRTIVAVTITAITFSASSNTSHSGDGDGDDSWYYSFDLSEN